MIYKAMFSWICASPFLTAIAGCAGELPRRDAAHPPADNQQAEPKREAYPTFTYRPGS
jgi:hypothetical protein